MAIVIGPNQPSVLNYISNSSSSDADSKQSTSVSTTNILHEQQSVSLIGTGISDVIQLSSMIADSPPVESVLEEGNSFHKTVMGNHRAYLGVDEELANRVDNILSRLSGEQGRDLIDLVDLHDESQLEYLEQLSDKDLKNLVRTGAALYTKGTNNEYTRSLTSAEKEFTGLIESLQKMNSKTASRVLEKSSELSMSVPLKIREKLTVYPPGTIPPTQEGHSSANNLHLFVRAINQLESDASESVSVKTNALIDGLSKFGEGQQNDLLLVLENVPELGMRFLEGISGFEKDVQEKALTYMADLVKSTRLSAQSAQDVAPNDLLGPGEWHGAVLDFDIKSNTATSEMMGNVVSLLEKYEFSEDQFTEMISDLNSLDKQGQRSYLDVTNIGLDHILGGSESNPVDLESNQSAVDVVDRLRSDSTVRTLIDKSRMGENGQGPEGHRYFAVKGRADGKYDQKQTIEVLVTDAWFNQDKSGRGADLANKLSELDADRRDQLVDELQSANVTGKSLNKFSSSSMENEFKEFFERTNVIHETDDINAFLDTVDELEENQQGDYWQAVNFLGEDAKSLTEYISDLEDSETKLLIDYMSNLIEQFNVGELEEDEALQQVKETIDIFAKLNEAREEINMV